MSSSFLERWEALVAAAGGKPGNVRWGARYTFEGVELAGATVLEIGTGRGWHSFYAACQGASAVVGLEPEAAGSRAGSESSFRRDAEQLGLENVRLEAATLQDFDAAGMTFDVVLSLASVNHLDEASCMALPHSLEARATYRALFDKIAGLMNPGGSLIVADCAPANLWPRLGLKNPFAPTIDWRKHQSPLTWAALLAESGFTQPRIRWRALNTLRQPGRILLGNRVGAYLFVSGFCLTMRLPGPPTDR